jgi:hypothetical protein
MNMKTAVVLLVLAWHSLGGTEEHEENAQAGATVPHLVFEMGISPTQFFSTTPAIISNF